ncbi:MAG TPA: class 1 isoprenoid biosynthesis enzyme, partial [Anaerolineae bacterium]|nr:class 1 isoprenoid biosynthesis enzyme [Anaerolineae bacterium]
ALWWANDTGTLALGPAYSARQQAAREAHLERFLDTVTAELERLSRGEQPGPPRRWGPHSSGGFRGEQPSPPRKWGPHSSGGLTGDPMYPSAPTGDSLPTQQRIISAFRTFARSALDFEERHLHALLSRGFTQALTEFAQAAHRFDPTLSGSDVFQASRNVSAMNGLQLLMGEPVRLTPAIFAYSMLYPYSDNYLDDPTIPPEAKAAFNDRLARRLAGEDVTPGDARERIVYDLVGMIEREFDRPRYPQAFESLLAIHRAQGESVRLLHRQASPYEVDVLGISLEKGGASVLADGYLVAGSLTQAQEEFLFGWGAFLQLVDDLQDVAGDRQGGLLTVFSQTATHWPLDGLTDRAFQFGARVLQRLDCFDAPGPDAAALKELMVRSASLLLVDAAGRAGRFHTRRYLRDLEAHSPFRFSFLNRSRQRLARQRVSLVRALEAFAASENTAPPGLFSTGQPSRDP